MLKKLFLWIILAGLAIFFWIAPKFQVVSAGVAILLFGMIALEKGFKSYAEGPLKRLLARSTGNFFKSFSLGAISTAILQSSSLISIITISFLSAGLLTLYQGIGIIFGSNLGTTATAWIVASLGLKLDIAAMAMPMIVFGLIFYLQSSRGLKGLGNILIGLGFFFLGIGLMKTGFESYQGSLDLTSIPHNTLWSKVLFLALGILITVILQSSSASMAIILSGLATDQISYDLALTMAIGANVGTTITSLLGAMASNVDGKRIAIAHLIFNLFTGIVALLLLNQLSWLVDRISDGIGIDENDYTMKLAVFHTVFNSLGIVLMLPLVKRLVVFLNTRIKSRDKKLDAPRYLNEAALVYPQTALEVMLKETKQISSLCLEAMAYGLGMPQVLTNGGNNKVNSIQNKADSTIDMDAFYYSRIKNVYGEIISFGLKAQRIHSDPRYIVAINNVMEACRYFIESVKDVKDLQGNVLKYTVGQNEIMRREYQKIRLRILKFAQIVTEYQQLHYPVPFSQANAEMVLDKINTKRTALQEYIDNLKTKDILLNGTLNNYIHDQSITSDMVSSLINDYRISYSINKHLLKASELLYLNPTLLMAEVEERISQ